MKRHYFCTVFILLVTGLLHLHAQLAGRVLDNLGHPVPFCNVQLEKAIDSQVIANAVTDTSGRFKFNQKLSGNYRARATYLGFKPFVSKVFTLSIDYGYNINDLVLSSSDITLQDVVVTAEKPFIERKDDRTVYNIDVDDLMSGKNGIEVMQSLPGVIATDDGELSIAGKSNTMVMIDGRPIHLSGQDATDFLKTFDASQIERVEIVTNPSAKYDATGGGIINIILKKGIKMGMNGNISLNDKQGYYNTAGGSFNLNYRTKKFNVYGNAGISNQNSYGYTTITRDFISNTPQQLFNENSMYHNQGYSPSGKIGFDFMPDETHTFSISTYGSYYHSTNYNDHPTIMYSTGPLPDSGNDALSTGTSSSNNINVDGSYEFKIDSTGKEFSVDLSYSNHQGTPSSQKIITYYTPTNPILHAPTIYNVYIPNSSITEEAQIDYTLPINKKNKIETGLKATSNTNDNNAEYSDVIQSTDVPDTTKSNHFKFEEEIYSAYVRYSHTFSHKLYFSAGAREENTRDKGIQFIHDTTFTRNYYNFFPDGNLEWNMDSANSLSINFRQGLQRPAYSELNPFLQYSTPFSYYQGSISLQPENTYNYTLTFSHNSIISLSVEYVHSTSLIEWFWQTNANTLISYNRPVNMASSDRYLIFASSYWKVTKWWTMTNYADVYKTDYSGGIEGINYNSTGLSWYVYSHSQFNYKKVWKAEISFYYNSTAVYGFDKNQPSYNMDAGISRTIAHERGTIKIGGNGILSPSSYAYSQNVAGTNISSASYWYPRRAYLSLTWKLGKMKH